MNILLRLYLRFFLMVFGLYTYFNKGVAYTYLAEASWVLGLFLILYYRRDFSVVWNRGIKVLLLILLINLAYIFRGLQSYELMDVIRDSFMFQYAGFVFIIAVLRPLHEELMQGLYTIYRWLPWIALSTLLLRTNYPEWNEFSLFGDIPLLIYKSSDLSVQLLISTFFLIDGKLNLSPRWFIMQIVVIAYLFLLMATFSRGGLVAFFAGGAIFLYYIRKTEFAKPLFRYLRLAPILLMIAIPLYMLTKIEDDTQGRNTGIKQLTDNVTSIVNRNIQSGSLNDNVLWRLAWWGTIVDYTIFGEYLLQGKGLGVNLSIDDQIPADESVRAPHNFHMNVLARYGVPFTLLWLYWLVLQFKVLRVPNMPRERLIYLCVMLAGLVNASFDVALEGPMAAMPFWVFTGLYVESLAKEEKERS